MTRPIIAAGVAVAVLALSAVNVASWLHQHGPLRDPAEALEDFYSGKNRAEDMLMDPLIRNGKAVVPLVLEAIPNKQMEKRRYAICFLGNGGYSEALPALESILKDTSEEVYFRADALEAITQISEARGKELAKEHTGAQGMLRELATAILQDGEVHYCERSWWEAFNGVHG